MTTIYNIQWSLEEDSISWGGIADLDSKGQHRAEKMHGDGYIEGDLIEYCEEIGREVQGWWSVADNK